jgi:molybdopterin molybdotransferase
MPTYAGIHGPAFVLALPGNPVSCMVTFEIFVRPLLDVMLGKREIGPRRGRAILTDNVFIKPDRRKFLRGQISEIDARLHVKLYSSQEAGVLRSMVESNVLVDIPSNVEKLKAGSEVDIVYLEWLS